MSIESAVVFDYNMNPIHWHLPLGRSSSHIPDSADLWSLLFQNRDILYGVAHSHPGRGSPLPSWTDITTFSACELGIGKRILWPIITEDMVSFFMWLGPNKYDYNRVFCPDRELLWIDKLRQYSYK